MIELGILKQNFFILIVLLNFLNHFVKLNS
jgi:hypothetical protein